MLLLLSSSPSSSAAASRRRLDMRSMLMAMGTESSPTSPSLSTTAASRFVAPPGADAICVGMDFFL